MSYLDNSLLLQGHQEYCISDELSCLEIENDTESSVITLSKLLYESLCFWSSLWFVHLIKESKLVLNMFLDQNWVCFDGLLEFLQTVPVELFANIFGLWNSWV